MANTTSRGSKSDAFSYVSSAINKLPPQNIEAEQSLLGALLIDKDAIVEIAEELQTDHFYKLDQHGAIYSAILDLFNKREPIDLITVTEKLKQKGLLDRVGGSAYLAELVNMVPTAAHIGSYCRIIKDHALRRGLISQSTKFIDSAYDQTIEVSEIIESSEQSIFALSQAHIKRDFIQLKDALAESFDRLDEISKSSGKLRGIATGFRDLDNKLAGFQDSNLIIFAARPGVGKCLAFDSKIVHPITGELKTIQEYYHQQIKEIFSLNSNLKIKKTQISQFVDDGKKSVFQVKTSLGKEIEVTASHPFLTVRGWKKLSELQEGDRIATPREIPVFGNAELEDYKIKLLAYFISDGGLTNSSPRFTNQNPVIVADFTESINKFADITVKRYDSSGTRTPSYEVVKKISNQANIRAYFSNALGGLVIKKGISQRYLSLQLAVSPASMSLWMSGYTIPNEDKLLLLRNYFNVPRDFFVPADFWGFSKNKVTKWLEEYSLMGKSALEKNIPNIIYSLPKNKMALFLNRLFSCDGCVSISHNSSRSTYDCRISYSSSSKELIIGVQHLLLRFGIISSVRLKKVKLQKKLFFSYELEILGSEDIVKFIKQIGIYSKEEKCNRALQLAEKRSYENNFTKDTIPIEVWEQIVKIKGNLSWRKIYQKMGLPLSHNIHAGKRHPKRSTLLKLANVLNSPQLLNLARSDIFWDRIVSITSTGIKQVYDLTIPKNHNFVANDFFVHNTSFALNIAQHVAVNLNLPVGIFSLEMSQEELVDRLLVAQADIDAWKLKTGRLDEKDFDRLSHAMGQLAEAPLFIDDTPGATLSEIRTKARRLQAEHGLKLIVVDYLQLVQTRSYADNRVQQVSEISQGLKNLARELKVPVLALSQLNRSVENRGGTKKPQLADLRESGAIEQDADVVMFIYREDEEKREQIKLDIQKHRNGPTGEIDLIFRGDRVKFYGMEKMRSKAGPKAVTA